jgi:hypothetical protein
VFIATADENNIPHLGTQITRINISWYIGSGQMAYVFESVGIGQGGGDEVTLRVLHDVDAKIPEFGYL